MRKKILVVDDDPSVRTLLTLNLAAEGYDIATAENGDRALEYIEKTEADLVILDIMMPGRDGWEVCKTIRDSESHDRRRKIIMLTARDTPRDKLIGKDLLGADEYVTKPFDIDELMEIVGKLVEK
jgi:DNA-binding response OmpR family regulator